jgi:hypothetical protein
MNSIIPKFFFLLCASLLGPNFLYSTPLDTKYKIKYILFIVYMVMFWDTGPTNLGIQSKYARRPESAPDCNRPNANAHITVI